MSRQRLTRRSFLRTASLAAAALTAPVIVPAHVLGSLAPSKRVNVAQIGAGNRGSSHLRGYTALPNAQLLAVCDCYYSLREEKSEWVNKTYSEARGTASYNGCKNYRDFREVLAREDIDAVSIATPDHWHVPIALAALRAGKDIYVEKPLSVALTWNQALRKAVHQSKAVFQYGTQQRSDKRFRQACELTRNQAIGRLERIEAWCPDISQQYNDFEVKQYGSTEPARVPDGLDFDQWIGPAPTKPYTVDRCTKFGAYHIYDYALGFIAGWGAHPLDIAQWGNNSDDTCPVIYRGKGEIPDKGLYDTVSTWDVHCEYQNGVTMRFMDWRVAEPVITAYRQFHNHGTTFFGTDGWVSVDRAGIYAKDPSILDEKPRSDGVHLYESSDQFANFVDCVLSRSTPVSSIDSAFQSDAICHLSNICVRTGRTIRWDPKKELILDDPSATDMLSRTLRSPWTL